MTGNIIDSIVEKGNDSDEQSEDSGNHTKRVRDIAALPAYEQFLLKFGFLQGFAKSCFNGEAAYSLQKARAPFIKPYAS